MTIQQSPVKKVQAPRNSTEVSYLLSIERKNCAQRNIFATLMSILKAIKPIVEGFGHPLTIHPVQQATDDPTIYDIDGLEEMKADLEGRYVTNISTPRDGEILSNFASELPQLLILYTC
jgi:predicted NACHT family NTPase